MFLIAMGCILDDATKIVIPAVLLKFLELNIRAIARVSPTQFISLPDLHN